MKIDRRKFVIDSLLLSGGGLVLNTFPVNGVIPFVCTEDRKPDSLFNTFSNPATRYRPFVRWWWNGNKVEAKELVRELNLLKDAGIGGVEINPISFPSREKGDDLGIPSPEWLSDDWISMLQVVFDETKKLGMQCDLIVGSGWPFGSEKLREDERASVILVYAEKIEGPSVFTVSTRDIYKSVDPGVTVPFPGRTFTIISLLLATDPMEGLESALPMPYSGEDIVSVDVGPGSHVFYALVRVDSFASVINGAPGAAGPILNHMDREAVKRYLDNMSDTIQAKTGPLAGHLRALFTDSMELEGCNWTSDFAAEFSRRRGYDIMPYLPFIMFRVGRLGAVIDHNYGAVKTVNFADELNRVRFDFEITKAELLYERFTLTYLDWCQRLGVKSRSQAYGRGFFPLESSLGYDIPEGESWTTNWLKHRVGEEMPDDDYRRGRAYTMINRYVSSAARLSGKRVVSCEEMTNTYLVFNTSLERLKVGSDQSIISGVTHSVWHGFNYSPPEAPYPGWIQYGSYYNEKNNWWPYFRYLNDYKARISALLQNSTAFSDIAILPANYDLWGEFGVQTDPFPEKLNVPYTSLLWESICKNGGSADYISEIIINDSVVRNGKLCYGSREYSIIIVAGVKSLNPETAEKLFNFVNDGGRIFCVERIPNRSPGLADYQSRDKEVTEWMRKTEESGNLILLELPEEESYLEWYCRIMEGYNLPGYVKIINPDPFFMQTRYLSDNGDEIFFFVNSDIHEPHTTDLVFSEKITAGRYFWRWDPETGKRYRLRAIDGNRINLILGPAESAIIILDSNKRGENWKEMSPEESRNTEITCRWTLEFIHCRGTRVEPVTLNALTDITGISGYSDFSGEIIYRSEVFIDGSLPAFINLGEVAGVSGLTVNGIDCGIKWYGKRLYPLKGIIRKGSNSIEIHVTTLMGNYMKSLTGNPNAQYWTNLGRKKQEPLPSGLIGPVTFCS